ncbi:MAG: carbohydrate ABC transporter permease, partial [Turicibacter sp.]
AKFSIQTLNTFHLMITIFCLVFILEGLLRIIVCKDFKRYFLFNKAELIAIILGIIIVPIAILSNGFDLCFWIVLFKMASILRRFNDDIVFDVIAKTFVAILIFIFIFPFLNVISMSISKPGTIVNVFPEGIDFFSMNYVLNDKLFFNSIFVAIFVTAVGTLISVFCMVLAAYPLSKPDLPFRRTFMVFFIIVMLFSGGMAPNILLVNSLGLTNTIWALILPSVVNVFHLLLLKGFFEGIPSELEESAKMDGASNYKILFKIVMPLSAAMIATVAFFTAISYWNNINNSILYITSNQSIYPLPMYIKNFLNRNPMDIAQSNPELLAYWDNIKMSYIFISIIPIACVYPFIFKYIKNGVAVGGVKG